MKLPTTALAAILIAAVLPVASRADTVIGDWENGSTDGWIDWGTQAAIASPKYEWTSFGATRGTGAIKVNAAGYNQNLSIKLQNNNLMAAFLANNQLSIDFSYPAETNPGYAQIYDIAINAESYGFHGESPVPKFTYGFPNGGPQTTTISWDYHRLVDGITSNGEVTAASRWIEFIIATNSDSTHGTLYFDNARLTRNASLGDFNHDGAVDALDIDLLLRTDNGDGADLMYDLNADNLVRSPINTGVAISDSDYWVQLVKGTKYGDTNLDKKVNFDDLLALAQNYGDQSTGTWAKGDFDGNNAVAFDDLLLLAQNYGFVGLVDGASPQFNADWALAQSLVPEPGSAMALGAMVLVRRRRAKA